MAKRRVRIPIHAWICGAVIALAGCDGPPADDGAASPSPASTADPMHSRASDEPELGLTTYRRYCIGCHGEKGDGKGPAARFLFPPPRDFTKGLYKFTTTPSGSLPTDEDLVRTITHGLRGTAMPSFRLLSRVERDAVIETLKAFYPQWNERLPAFPVTRYTNPFDMDPEYPEEHQEAIALGEELYHGKTTCWNCHPAYVDAARRAAIGAKYDKTIDRPDIDKPLLKPDEWGQLIPPPDFKTMKLKSVRGLDDLYRVIAAGVGGTAMPTWQDSLTGKEAWALTLYVDSLVKQGMAERLATIQGEAK